MLDVNVEVSPDANTTIKTRPQPKLKEKAEPVITESTESRRRNTKPDLEHCSGDRSKPVGEVAEEEAEEPAEQIARKPKPQSSRWIGVRGRAREAAEALEAEPESSRTGR